MMFPYLEKQNKNIKKIFFYLIKVVQQDRPSKQRK